MPSPGACRKKLRRRTRMREGAGNKMEDANACCKLPCQSWRKLRKLDPAQCDVKRPAEDQAMEEQGSTEQSACRDRDRHLSLDPP